MPRGPRKLAIEFGATGLTHYGGVYLLHRFLSRIGFKDAIAREIHLIPGEHQLLQCGRARSGQYHRFSRLIPGEPQLQRPRSQAV